MSRFWIDEVLESAVVLDAVITMIDAKYFLTSWEEFPELAATQVAYADRIIINKMDQVIKTTSKEDIETRIREINQVAELTHTSYSKVSLDFIFNVGSFNTNPHWARLSKTAWESHHRLSSVITELIPLEQEVDRQRLEGWLHQLLWDHVLPCQHKEQHKEQPKEQQNLQIFRGKGLFQADSTYFSLQIVQELYEINEEEGLMDLEPEMKKLVFIGKGFEKGQLQSSLYQFLKGEN